MKERLPYKIIPLGYGEKGARPKEALYSSIKTRNIHLPPYFNSRSKDFLSEAINNNAYEGLDSSRRDLIFKYLFTPASTKSLASESGINSYSDMAERLRRIMVKMWKNLPQDLKNKYSEKEVRKLKDHRTTNRTESGKRKMVKAVRTRYDQIFIEAAQSVDIDYTKGTRKGPMQKKAALFNLLYMEGPSFPSFIRNRYTQDPFLSAIWRSEVLPQKPALVYKEGNMFFQPDLDNPEQMQKLTPDLLEEIWQTTPARRRDYLRRFAISTKDELRSFAIAASLKIRQPTIVRRIA